MNVSFTQLALLAASRNVTHRNRRVAGKRLTNGGRVRSLRDADDRRLVAAAGKGERHRDRHQDWKDEGPEDGFRFARELAQPPERQLDERMPRAAAID